MATLAPLENGSIYVNFHIMKKKEKNNQLTEKEKWEEDLLWSRVRKALSEEATYKPSPEGGKGVGYMWV